MNIIESQQGKIFRRTLSEGEILFARGLILGAHDSIDNYEEVDESEYEAYLEEQKKKEQEEELHRLLREMYPEESTTE